MSRFRVFVVALFALLVVGVGVVSSASAALPTILFLSGETVPAELKGESTTAKTKLSTAVSTLTGQGWLFQLHYTNSSINLGVASLLFTKVVLGTKECKSAADKSQLVLIDDAEWHLVFTSLSPLQVGILILLTKELEISCIEAGSTGKPVIIKIKGNQLVSSSPTNKEVLTTESFEGLSLCEGAHNEKPKLKTWENSAGAVQSATLLASFGLGFENSCQLIGEAAAEFPIALKPTKMIEIMG